MPSAKAAEPHLLAAFRVVLGLLFASHGAKFLFGVLGGESVAAGTWPGWYAAVIELVGGSLVLLGLGTRIAAVIASGSMAYAYFTVHAGNALFPIENGGELAALFSWAFLLIAVTGPGSWALDSLLGSTRRTRSESTPRPEPEKATA